MSTTGHRELPNTVKRLLTMTSNIPTYTADPPGFQLHLYRRWALAARENLPFDRYARGVRLQQHQLFSSERDYRYRKRAKPASNHPVSQLHQSPYLFARGHEQQLVHRRSSVTRHRRRRRQPLSEPRYNLPDWPKGAGDIRSTAADLARWNSALMSGAVINQSMLATMLLAAVPVPAISKYVGCNYGMGWFVCPMPGYLLYRHDGEISGF